MLKNNDLTSLLKKENFDKINFYSNSLLKVLRSITPLFVVLLFLFSTDSVNAQCTEPSCLPNTALDGANGPDPCAAKLYCSNSGAVQTGLINCTHAADTDGCGVNADADHSNVSQYDDAIQATKNLFSGGECLTGEFLQWIVFATPPTVKGTKIQGVGAVDSWWLFHAGSVTIPGDYNSVEEALTEPSRCNSFDSTGLVVCSDANQWEPWTNEEAVIGENIYNVYYIALFWNTPTNGSLNFKVKECELQLCDTLAVNCPDDVTIDCNGVVQQNAGAGISDNSTDNLTTAFDIG